MLKLLIGSSPCTKWSIAQKNDRETEPNSGLGWELFLNYKIAYDKYKPDYFLYENNKSASQPIKDEIARLLNVTQPDLLTPDNGVRMTNINSALLSGQKRERFYVTNFGDIDPPKDRGILLKDILEHGVVEKEKAYSDGLTTSSSLGNAKDLRTTRKDSDTYAKKILSQSLCRLG